MANLLDFKITAILAYFCAMPRSLSVLVLTCLAFTSLSAQGNFIVKKDVRNDWMVFNGRGYDSIEAGDADGRNSIHFVLKAQQFSGDYLQIKSRRPFHVFVNGMLMGSADGQFVVALDSIARNFPNQDQMYSVYQPSLNADDLVTTIITTGSSRSGHEPRPPSFFNDFVNIAGLVLLLFFVVMLRMQPRLTADYFSVSKIISLREGEDKQSHARFALSSEVWFYTFLSLLLSLFLIVIFYHLPDRYPITAGFKSHSFGSVCWQWLRLAFIILSILLTRAIVIVSLSGLFGMNGIAGLHFFNIVRLLLVVVSAFSVVAFIYFTSRGHDPEVYALMLSILVFILAMWIVLVFLKLNNKTEHSMFHLFSYICATEVLPLLITVKVLFQ